MFHKYFYPLGICFHKLMALLPTHAVGYFVTYLDAMGPSEASLQSMGSLIMMS